METIKSRVYAFLELKGITVSKFEERCGLSNGYVSSMRKGFGTEKLSNVLSEFPELNRDWLLFGEGPMLKSADIQNYSNGNNGTLTQISGVRDITNRGGTTTHTTTNHYSGCSEIDQQALAKALEEISEQRKLVAKAQEQIDTLLELLKAKMQI